VILVKKHYQARKKNKVRNWKLKRMGLHDNDEMKPRKQDADRDAIDYEQFLQDLEQDPELRQGANLYRDEQKRKAEAAAESEMDTDADSDDEGLQIPMDQLIDEMEEMGMRDD